MKLIKIAIAATLAMMATSANAENKVLSCWVQGDGAAPQSIGFSPNFRMHYALIFPQEGGGIILSSVAESNGYFTASTKQGDLTLEVRMNYKTKWLDQVAYRKTGKFTNVVMRASGYCI